MNICTSGNKQLPSNLARGNKLEFDVDENDYENTEPKTYEEEKEVTMTSLIDLRCLKAD